MSGKIHCCNEEPVLSTVFWSDSAKKWLLIVSVVNEGTFFTMDTQITYCPYCGEKLKEPDEDD